MNSSLPVAFAQQLHDTCQRWLLAEDHNTKDMVDLVVLVQFVTQILQGTAEWVQCHHLALLGGPVQLAEDQLVVSLRTGKVGDKLLKHPEIDHILGAVSLSLQPPPACVLELLGECERAAEYEGC